LAGYFGLDSLLVRIIFVVLALSGGVGILLYLAAWLIIPLKPAALENQEQTGPGAGQNNHMKERSSAMILGIVLVLVGIGFLLDNYGLFHIKFSLIWPLILIAIGIKLIIRDKK